MIRIAIAAFALATTTLNATHLLLVRHGETHRNKAGDRISGQEDGPLAQLNDKGRQQADEAGKALSAEYAGKVVAIYASTLQRAQDTAAIIGTYFPGVPIYSDPRLMEFNHGKYDTWPYKLRNETCIEKFKEMQETDSYFKWKLSYNDLIEYKPGITETPKEGEPETALEVLTRATEAIGDIQKKHPDDIVIVVSHGGVIRTLGIDCIWKANGLTTPRPMYFESTVRAGNCSITHFEATADGQLTLSDH